MSYKTITLPSMIMIAGQQQNVGKTTLACDIIARFSRNYHIYGLKVTPHFHQNTGEAKIVRTNNQWQLLEEKSIDSCKDTSRMLLAGAEKAFLLQGDNLALGEGLSEFLQLISQDVLIVCESAGLRDFVVPGIFLVIRQLNCKVCNIDDEKIFNLADRIITFTVNGFDFSISSLDVKNGRWILKND